jgi:hypothetical protein
MGLGKCPQIGGRDAAFDDMNRRFAAGRRDADHPDHPHGHIALRRNGPSSGRS